LGERGLAGGKRKVKSTTAKFEASHMVRRHQRRPTMVQVLPSQKKKKKKKNKKKKKKKKTKKKEKKKKPKKVGKKKKKKTTRSKGAAKKKDQTIFSKNVIFPRGSSKAQCGYTRMTHQRERRDQTEGKEGCIFGEEKKCLPERDGCKYPWTQSSKKN